MEQKIKSVEKGWGESSIFFSVDSKVGISYRVDEIKEETKHVGNGEYCELTKKFIVGTETATLFLKWEPRLM